MGSYTLVRVESRSGLLGRLLDVLPGVETVGTLDDSTADDSAEPTALTKIRTAVGPPAREYGLLAGGGSLIATGLSAVGLWWYRQRGDDTAPERQSTSEPIDAAPLLGIAFLVITGAVARWIKRGPTR